MFRIFTRRTRERAFLRAVAIAGEMEIEGHDGRTLEVLLSRLERELFPEDGLEETL